MLASTLAGEAAASAVIRDLLKNDDLVKLPKAETPRPTPIVHAPNRADDAIKARRLSTSSASRPRPAPVASSRPRPSRD